MPQPRNQECEENGKESSAQTILTILARYNPTGMGKRLCRAAKAVADSGTHVAFISCFPPPCGHQRIRLETIHPPPFLCARRPDHTTPLFWWWFNSAASLRALRLALRNDVKAMFAFNLNVASPFLLARWITRKPLVVFIRSNERAEALAKKVPPALRMVAAFLQSLVIKHASRLVPVSQSLANQLAQIHGEHIRARITVLPNDLPPVPPLGTSAPAAAHASTTPTIVLHARFDAGKNAAVLIRAVAEIHNPPVKLLLIGDGPDMVDLRNLAGSLGASSRVIFAGWREDATAMLGSCDLFVLPSLSEGMSNSLLEALAAGLPCLASRIEEHREVLDDEALLFDPRDPEDLRDKIERFFNSGSYAAKVRLASASAARRYSFDWDRTVVKLIEDAIKNKDV